MGPLLLAHLNPIVYMCVPKPGSPFLDGLGIRTLLRDEDGYMNEQFEHIGYESTMQTENHEANELLNEGMNFCKRTRSRNQKQRSSYRNEHMIEGMNE